MNIKKIILASVLVLTLVLGMSAKFARAEENGDSEQSSVSSSRQMSISQLMAIIAELKRQIALLQGGMGSRLPQECRLEITQDLYLGDGDNGANAGVVALQRALQKAGYLRIPPQVPFGFFGNLTHTALKSFQNDKGINEIRNGSAYAGPLTRAALSNCSSLPPVPLTLNKVDLKINGSDGTVNLQQGTEMVAVSWSAPAGTDYCTVGPLLAGAIRLNGSAGDRSLFTREIFLGSNSATLSLTCYDTTDAGENESSVRIVGSDQVKVTADGYSSSTNLPLSCTLTSDKSSYTLGDTITFSWTSQNATYGSWVQDTSGKDHLNLPSDKLVANGSQQVIANVVGNPSATLSVAGRYSGSGNALCTKTVNVGGGDVVEEEHESLTSPSIVSSNPASGSTDAGQVVTVVDNTREREDVRVFFSGLLPNLNKSDWSVVSSGNDQVSVLYMTVSGGTSTNGQTVQPSSVGLQFDRPLPAGQCTVIAHKPSHTYITLKSLPGDVNADGVVNTQDLSAMINQQNGVKTYPLSQVDIDRSGAYSPTQDYARLLDVVNGTAFGGRWYGRFLPACPAPQF